MERPLFSSVFKTALLIVPLVLSFAGLTVVKAGDSDLLPIGAVRVRPAKLDDLAELAHGYLKVYSATDEFKEGDTRYFPHSPYAIYTLDGKLFKNVKN